MQSQGPQNTILGGKIKLCSSYSYGFLVTLINTWMTIAMWGKIMHSRQLAWLSRDNVLLSGNTWQLGKLYRIFPQLSDASEICKLLVQIAYHRDAKEIYVLNILIFWNWSYTFSQLKTQSLLSLLQIFLIIYVLMFQNKKWWLSQPLGKYAVLHRNPFLGSNIAWLSYKERKQIARIIEQSQSNSALCRLQSSDLRLPIQSRLLWPTLSYTPNPPITESIVVLHWTHTTGFYSWHHFASCNAPFNLLESA